VYTAGTGASLHTLTAHMPMCTRKAKPGSHMVQQLLGLVLLFIGWEHHA
jgi:hypothetical protein